MHGMVLSWPRLFQKEQWNHPSKNNQVIVARNFWKRAGKKEISKKWCVKQCFQLQKRKTLLKILHRPQNTRYMNHTGQCMYGACTVYWGMVQIVCCVVSLFCNKFYLFVLYSSWFILHPESHTIWPLKKQLNDSLMGISLNLIHNTNKCLTA